jgi:cytochrome P450/ferredoxin-NADP reductase
MTNTAPTLDFDPLSTSFQRRDPFDTYRRLRDEAPVYHSEKWSWWALSRFDDVRNAVLDPATYLSFEGIDIDDTAKDQSGPGFLPDIDNPRHDQIRRVIQPYFLPRRISEQKHNVQRVVRGLVDGWRTRGSVDLAAELSWPMPNEVFFRVLGLPYSDDEGAAHLMRWVHELKDRAPDDVRLTPVAKAATRGIQDYFVELLNDRRRRPRNDLVSYLVQADIDGTPFADEDIEPASEIMGLMMVLFLGGVESTAGLTSTTFKLLAENPDQRDLVLEDPTLIPDAVEETLRFATPLQLVGRTTSREVELHGVTIPAGGRVVLLYGAANRDDRQYPEPDRFDITRRRGRHLGFSEGMHGCLGAPLARLEVQTALEEALPVLGRYQLAGEPQRYATTPNMYVWSSLPLRFDTDQASARRSSVPLEPVVEVAESTTSMFTSATRELVTEVRVHAKELVSEGVAALTLTATDGKALPPWTPGAHVDLLLGAAPTRQYSLCGRTDDTDSYRIGVLRDDQGSGGSRYVHELLQPGDTVRVRGPRNHFGLQPSPRYIFVAGGIGITPVLPMIAAAEAAGATWELLYGGRRRGSMAFLDELAAYGDRVTVWPEQESGLLDLDGLLGIPREDTLVYACGPEPLLAAIEQRCILWPHGALHLERFAPKPMGEPVRAEAFDVVLERSGLTVTVPSDRSILSVVEEAGVGVVSSCAEGTCGTCETRVLQGSPDHRDSVLREEEKAANACMMICVSRSCGERLVLDL